MSAIKDRGAERYLGDGLYVSYDGWQIRLRAPLHDGEHIVYLEPQTLDEFLQYVKHIKEAS